MRLLKHLSDRLGCRRPLQNRQHLRISKPSLRMNDGAVKFCVEHAAILRDEKFHASGQTVHIGLERAEFVAQRLRQHRYDTVHQIGGIATFLRLRVER